MPRRWIVCALLLTTCSWTASFDRPLSTKIVDLGPSEYSSGSRARVRCVFFAGFMVKEVDLGEKGASRLAILPGAKARGTRCKQAQDKSELVINPDEWSGYFKGVRNGLVFFDADDGVNGGMGFAVYEAKTAKKIFSDSAVGDLQFAERPDNLVAIRYTRLIQVDCVLPTDPPACWERVSKDLGLVKPAPDCKAGYEKSAQALAKGRCEAQKGADAQCIEEETALARKQTDVSPSVIVYPAEVVLEGTPVAKPLAGDLRCWPAD